MPELIDLGKDQRCSGGEVKLPQPGIFTQCLSSNLGGNPSTCGKIGVCHAGLDECFQAWVMLWDRTWEGFGSINSLREKTAMPETSRLLVSSQMQIHTWTDGSTRGLGRWRETWWNTWCLGDWGCAFTAPQTKCITDPTVSVCPPLCRGYAGEKSHLFTKQTTRVGRTHLFSLVFNTVYWESPEVAIWDDPSACA